MDGDVGLRFTGTDAAVAAITEAIDCGACNTSAGRNERTQMIPQKRARVQPRDCGSAQKSKSNRARGFSHSDLDGPKLGPNLETCDQAVSVSLYGIRGCASHHPWVNAIHSAQLGPLQWARTTVGRRPQTPAIKPQWRGGISPLYPSQE